MYVKLKHKTWVDVLSYIGLLESDIKGRWSWQKAESWYSGFISGNSRLQNSNATKLYISILPCCHILTKASGENRDAALPASPWSSNRHQASERERELERLVFMLLNHTSHTDLKSPVRECPLCEKVGGLWIVRADTCPHNLCLYLPQ